MNDMRIAVCIPTFNRKNLLIKTLEAVSLQSLKPKCIFLFDNHSSDGTQELLIEKDYINEINGVTVEYFYSEINGGGALGFYHGMKTAFDKGCYDAFWMLDDDGIPAINCLELLSKYIKEYNYVSPILMDINNPELLNVPYNGSRDPKILMKANNNSELLEGYCNPFNGGLYSLKAVKKVGFPKPELFIYGDEMNYHQRMVEAGFRPYGVFLARHMHPIVRTDNLRTFAHCVRFRDVKWSFYCACRNSVYNKKTRKEFLLKKIAKLAYYGGAHILFFILINPSFVYLRLFIKSFQDGIFERWGRQYEFINK